VTIPPPGGGAPPSAPTGVVFNPTPANFGGEHFIFATEDGTIACWTSGTSAALNVDIYPRIIKGTLRLTKRSQIRPDQLGVRLHLPKDARQGSE
jgi:hypothetical protein